MKIKVNINNNEEDKKSLQLKNNRTRIIVVCIGILVLCTFLAGICFDIFNFNNTPNEFHNNSFRISSQPQVWPLPANFTLNDTSILEIDPTDFFIITDSSSYLLSAAINRYSFEGGWLFNHKDSEIRKNNIKFKTNSSSCSCSSSSSFTNQVKFLSISVQNNSDSLFLGIDESYILSVSSPKSFIVAPTVQGALRGLETFAQLINIYQSTNTTTTNTTNTTNTITQNNTVYYRIPQTEVQDAPRFKFRGLLVDVARHYLNITRLDDILKSMVLQKLNIMLLHLTDDQSFPFVSKTHPNLTRPLKPGLTYTHDDFIWLNQRAKEYGIMIQVELDLPAHASSWKGEPNLLICNGNVGSGLLNPIPGYPYQVLVELYSEFSLLFDSSIIHLGGDEVNRACWENSPQIVEWASTNGLQVPTWDCPNKTICSVECYFHYHQTQAALDAGFKNLFMWEDVRGCLALQNLDSVAVIDVWDQDTEDDWRISGVPSAIQHGFKEVVVSSGCYFLKFPPPWASGNWTWENNYQCDIQNISSLNSDQLQLVIGGHASRWGESSNADNWFNNTYPSLAGVAEKLWSPADKTIPNNDNLDAAKLRVQSVLCRMLRLNLGPFDTEYGNWPFSWCD